MRVLRSSRGAAAALGVGMAVAPLDGGAQRTQVTGTLDVGAATVAYDEFVRSSVGTLTPSLRVEHGRANFVARGSYSRFESGRSSLEGTIAASVISPAVRNVRGELFGLASNTRYSRLKDAATNVMVVGRLHVASAERGLWLGSGLGAVSQGFFFPDDIVQLDAGGWVRVGDGTVTAHAVPTRIGDIRYTDFVATARWEPLRAELSATVGYRDGARSSGVSRWAEVGGAFWFTSHVAVVGGGGVFPAEIWRGLPGGRYASAALRVATRNPRASDPQRLAELTLPYELNRLRRPRAVAQRFTVSPEVDGTRTLHVRVAGAREVELMGDFTDWTPVRLTPTASGVWSFNVFLAPGVHRVNLRVDGGPWIVPPGLTAVRDEFGGDVGLLIVQ
jgi:hypothetical protein